MTHFLHTNCLTETSNLPDMLSKPILYGNKIVDNESKEEHVSNTGCDVVISNPAKPEARYNAEGNRDRR